ncbi:MAG TPA: hypothetical protein VFV05_09510 [Methylomirabilota bacterium]|nr:hypothetical protein [Methylomirabilota bacterium]
MTEEKNEDAERTDDTHGPGCCATRCGACGRTDAIVHGRAGCWYCARCSRAT